MSFYCDNCPEEINDEDTYYILLLSEGQEYICHSPACVAICIQENASKDNPVHSITEEWPEGSRQQTVSVS